MGLHSSQNHYHEIGHQSKSIDPANNDLDRIEMEGQEEEGEEQVETEPNDTKFPELNRSQEKNKKEDSPSSK